MITSNAAQPNRSSHLARTRRRFERPLEGLSGGRTQRRSACTASTVRPSAREEEGPTRSILPPELEKARAALAPAEKVALPTGSLDAVYAVVSEDKFLLRFGDRLLEVGWSPLGRSICLQPDGDVRDTPLVDLTSRYPWRAAVGMPFESDSLKVPRGSTSVELRFRNQQGSSSQLSIRTRRGRLEVQLTAQTVGKENGGQDTGAGGSFLDALLPPVTSS